MIVGIQYNKRRGGKGKTRTASCSFRGSYLNVLFGGCVHRERLKFPSC
ncbi:Uncharacterized protein APZ42_025910 [Daphnia magna]|uniref:Uncharacterized protein n=1 Tax=Daphnia magna TaxID=35525 RepID=A0A164SN11_9CRUS|nr:Uncharacterized protein APZ42_025910 [Daphnia magna]